ncbi:hypothetical protein FOS14_11995 [Skermania sp. ID1734]|uniref:hypothetical protein n=1 Tax=Skermania sp. ID1734 TaxID=2597516 RepID=UPI00117BEAAF|nr:hypothetical protein [Skermania sp. ID1734]TSD99495.1 hypothetical protein FOS14_11995 [Skermania sp. ID1734]
MNGVTATFGRALAAVALTATTALTTAGLGVVASAAADPAPQSVNMNGDVQLAGGNILHVVAQATKAANGTTTGTFLATGELGSMPLPMTFAGPMTCLSVHGNTAGFIYPVTAVTPTFLAPVLQNTTAVMWTVTQAANGQPAHAGLIGPLPIQAFNGCEPNIAPLPFVGTLSVTG